MEHLLNTKFFVPTTRPAHVPRPRLIERLNGGLRHKMTLISAPAGFGKTTLVSTWVDVLQLDDKKANQIANRIAWLSLDESDNDPTRFLKYVVATLDRNNGIETTSGQNVLTMLQSSQPPTEDVVLTALINAVATVPDRVILILDDFHIIDSPPIFEALTFLLEHLPPQMHLVITTREDPPLPLGRLRARAQLTEIRATDLRFSSSEAATFLNRVMRLDLSPEEISALEDRTEGWIAGLQLAALALQRTGSMQGQNDTANFIQSFSGSHRFVLDYLIEEVLERQAPSIQEFLRQTAILDRMTGSLCDSLTGQENGQMTLEMLEQANLFIVPLDQGRRWYRYHHLFADLLRQRLRQTQPEHVSTLHKKASRWYQQNGFIDEAIEYALRGEHYEEVAHLIEDQIGANYERIDQTTWRRWLDALPDELVFSRPGLHIVHAWNLFNSGQMDAADKSLQAIEEMLAPSADRKTASSLDHDTQSNTNRINLAGHVAAMRSFIALYSEKVPDSILHANHALEYLPKSELSWRAVVLITLGDAYAGQGQMAAAHETRSEALVASRASGDPFTLMIVHLRLAEILRQQGHLHQVIDICEDQHRKAHESGISESVLVGWLLGIWGEVLAEHNDLERAMDQANKGVRLTADSSDVLTECRSNLCLLRVLFSSGDLTGAEDVIRLMESFARERDVPSGTLVQFSAWQVRIWLAQDKLAIASQWLRERDIDPDGELTYLHETEYIVSARVLIAQGRLQEANQLLQRLVVSAETGGRTSQVIRILILKALALRAGGNIDSALDALEQALTLAEPGGFIRTFVDEGPPMASLLREAATRGISPDYVRRLLEAFTTDEPERASTSRRPTSNNDLIEPLSDREIEVLQFISKGLTNQQVGARLFLSPHTIKVHTRNIYGKLGVNNRMGAVTRARNLGILPID